MISLSPVMVGQVFGLALYWFVTLGTTLRPGLVRDLAKRNSAHFVGGRVDDLHRFADWYSILLTTPIAATALCFMGVSVAVEEGSAWTAGAVTGAYGFVMIMWGVVAALGPPVLTGELGKISARAAFGWLAAGVQTVGTAVALAAA